MLSKGSCVIVYNEDGAVNSMGFELKKKKKEMGCVTETPDYTSVSCLFYIINLS